MIRILSRRSQFKRKNAFRNCGRLEKKKSTIVIKILQMGKKPQEILVTPMKLKKRSLSI